MGPDMTDEEFQDWKWSSDERSKKFHSILERLKKEHGFKNIYMAETLINEDGSVVHRKQENVCGLVFLRKGKVIVSFHLYGAPAGYYEMKERDNVSILFSCADDVLACVNSMKKGIW